MATQNLQHIEVVGTISGNAPQMWSFEEAASQTYAKGAVVSLDGSGYVIIGTTDEDKILGVAEEPGNGGSSAGDESSLIAIANEDTIFAANVYHATEASAVTTRMMVGVNYNLSLVSARFHILISSQATPSCLIIRLDPRDTVGDVYGRVWFQFTRTYRALGWTS